MAQFPRLTIPMRCPQLSQQFAQGLPDSLCLSFHTKKYHAQQKARYFFLYVLRRLAAASLLMVQ